jgi:aspartate aminotransferase
MLTSLTSSQFLRTTTLRAFSLWQHVPLGLPDSILGLSLAFNEDTTSDKVLLGAGTFRDNNGQPFILRSVYEAEKRMLEQGSNHEYAIITGLLKF